MQTREKITPEAELVLLIAREVVYNKRIEKIKDLIDSQDINWARFKEFIIYHELIPFAYLGLKDHHSLLPQELIEFLKSSYYFFSAYSLYLYREFLRLLSFFKEAKITLLPIKGIAFLADIYPERLLRAMVDIDVLVKEEELLRAEGIFHDLGYEKKLYGLKEKYWRERQCHIVFYKKEPDRFSPPIELHWALDFKRKRQILPNMWNRMRKIQANNREIELLSSEDTLFSLALHRRRFGKTLCLKNVLDGALLLNKCAVNFDWDYILKESKKGRMRSTIFFFLFQVQFLMNINIPKAVWKSLGIPVWKKRLIHRVIQRETFSESLHIEIKGLYLKSHFLLYDSLWEPVEYVLNIPQEQFAKFYDLKPYTDKTNAVYRIRLLYILYKKFADLLYPERPVNN